MRLRDTFFRKFGANNFGGATFGTWLQILRDNRYSIDLEFWPRAAMISLFAATNSLSAIIERLRYGKAIDAAQIEPPIFVLGAWRSGTTHLHNLLALDPRFAYPAQFEVTCPRTFLTTERLGSRIFDWCVPRRRPQDAMKMGSREAQEEDFAMCALSGQASLLAWAFPRNTSFYNRYMTMTGLSTAELERWKSTYQGFLKKLAYKHGRPLILKSPANTGRIRTLLELFPEARFVTIHRHPYDVFRSLTHTFRTAGPWWQLQRRNYYDEQSMNDELIEQLKTLFHGYFAERSLIPPGNLHEIGFSELESDPISQLCNVYEALRLPEFSVVEPKVRGYLASLMNYRKNEFRPLATDLQCRLQKDWSQCFTEWGYVA